MNLRLLISGFIAGALAVPLFHQALLLFFKLQGWSKRPVYELTPTQPLGVPALFSLMFWGGVWGILLSLLLSRLNGALYWVIALLAGAVAPSIIAWLIVMPLKGYGLFGGGSRALIVGTLLVNAAWGLGVAVLLRVLKLITP